MKIHINQMVTNVWIVNYRHNPYLLHCNKDGGFHFSPLPFSGVTDDELYYPNRHCRPLQRPRQPDPFGCGLVLSGVLALVTFATV
jgi:hypothetical protein